MLRTNPERIKRKKNPKQTEKNWYLYITQINIKKRIVTIRIIVLGCARGVMVIVVGIGHDDTSSNPGRDWLHFT